MREFYIYKSASVAGSAQLCRSAKVLVEAASRTTFWHIMTDMRPVFYVSLVLLGWAVTGLSADDPMMRINDILNDDATLQYYAKCFLDQGPCPSDGRAFKRVLPDFVATSCARCSPKNREMACKIIFTLQQPKYANLWADFLKKYDPISQHRLNLGSFMQSCREDHLF